MSGFAYRIDRNGVASRIGVKEALTEEAALVWVHLTTTGEKARQWLSETAGLSEFVVDALTATETRPSCSALDDGALINMRGRSSEALTSSDPLASVRIWAIRGHVFSVTRKPLVAVDHVERALDRRDIDDPGDLITEFAVAITEDLDPEVAELGDSLDDCESALSSDQVFELRTRVAHVRVKSIGYRRFLQPQRAAIEKLAQLDVDWLEPDDRLHLSAAADRAARMAEELESIRERASLVHETLTDLRAEQLDTRSLIISIAAMVFLPLTFITGLYGMNVKGLPYAEEPWAFDAIAGACALIAAGIVIYFLRRHWFRR